MGVERRTVQRRPAPSAADPLRVPRPRGARRAVWRFGCRPREHGHDGPERAAKRARPVGQCRDRAGGASLHPVEFAPFGETTLGAQAQTGILTGFTGHEHDQDLGLIDMGGRMYDPTLGRFLTADPVMQAPSWTQGLNRYSYVFNNPVNNVDPDGFQAVPLYAMIGTTRRPPIVGPDPALQPAVATESMAGANAASSTSAVAGSGTAAGAASGGSGAAAGGAGAASGGGASAGSSAGARAAAAAGTAAGIMMGRIMSRSLGSGNKTGRVQTPTSTSGDAPRGRSPHDATGQNRGGNFIGCSECQVNRSQLTPEQREAMNGGTAASAGWILGGGSLVRLGAQLLKAAGEAVLDAATKAAAEGGKNASRAARAEESLFLRATRAGYRLHGKIPNRGELQKLATKRLTELREMAARSIRTREYEIRLIGDKGGHGSRIGQERRLLKAIEEILKTRGALP